VHRLDLGVLVVEPLQRADPEQPAVVVPDAVERDGRVQQPVQVEGEAQSGR
jgi:hypothetical protein